jgi:hypothetical protein
MTFHIPKIQKQQFDLLIISIEYEPVCLLDKTISCSIISNRSLDTLHGDAVINSPLIFSPTTIDFVPI